MQGHTADTEPFHISGQGSLWPQQRGEKLLLLSPNIFVTKQKKELQKTQSGKGMRETPFLRSLGLNRIQEHEVKAGETSSVVTDPPP